MPGDSENIWPDAKSVKSWPGVVPRGIILIKASLGDRVMFGRWIFNTLVIVCVFAACAFGQSGDQQMQEKLMPSQNIALPWIVGIGILAGTLIAGLKHPGRTHLD